MAINFVYDGRVCVCVSGTIKTNGDGINAYLFILKQITAAIATHAHKLCSESKLKVFYFFSVAKIQF